VAILAELVRLRASGALAGRAGAGEAGAAGAGVAATATDPVCGMTVTAGPSGRPLDHDGRAYYFCSAGCRRTFETDPAAYLNRESRC
jgi:YHS domain-containing protein